MDDRVRDQYDALEILRKYNAVKRLPPTTQPNPARAIELAGQALRAIGGRAELDRQYSESQEPRMEPPTATGTPVAGPVAPAGIPPVPFSGSVAAPLSTQAPPTEPSAPAPAAPLKEEPWPDLIRNYVIEAAQKRGIDPALPLFIIQSEGQVDTPEQWGVGDNGTSFGPFQLHMASEADPRPGMGDTFYRKTGKHPRDINTWREQIDFVMDRIAEIGPNRQELEKVWYGLIGKPLPDNLKGIVTDTGESKTVDKTLSRFANIVRLQGENFRVSDWSVTLGLLADEAFDELDSPNGQVADAAVKKLEFIKSFIGDIQRSEARKDLSAYERAQVTISEASHTLSGQRFGLEQEKFGMDQEKFGFEREEAGLNRQERQAEVERKQREFAATFGLSAATALQGAEAGEAKLRTELAERAFAPGQEYWRGYEPGGQQEVLSRWANLPFAPFSRAQGIPVSTDMGAERLREALEALRANYPVPAVGG